MGVFLSLHNGNGRPELFLGTLWIQSKLVPRIYAFFFVFIHNLKRQWRKILKLIFSSALSDFEKNMPQ